MKPELIEFMQGRLAQHRRLYMHVRDGGQVNAQIDGGRISAMIADIENLLILAQGLDSEVSRLQAAADELTQRNANQVEMIESLLDTVRNIDVLEPFIKHFQ